MSYRRQTYSGLIFTQDQLFHGSRSRAMLSEQLEWRPLCLSIQRGCSHTHTTVWTLHIMSLCHVQSAPPSWLASVPFWRANQRPVPQGGPPIGRSCPVTPKVGKPRQTTLPLHRHSSCGTHSSLVWVVRFGLVGPAACGKNVRSSLAQGPNHGDAFVLVRGGSSWVKTRKACKLLLTQLYMLPSRPSDMYIYIFFLQGEADQKQSLNCKKEKIVSPTKRDNWRYVANQTWWHLGAKLINFKGM